MVQQTDFQGAFSAQTLFIIVISEARKKKGGPGVYRFCIYTWHCSGVIVDICRVDWISQPLIL